MDRMAIMASTTMRKTATAALAACFVLPGTASATNVLFGFVGTATYVTDGQQLAGMIAALPGFNVTQRTLNTAVYNDYGSFDQVWVYDLVTGSDNNPFQTANYQNIAAWYNSLSNKNLIVDGRIISSAPNWTNAGGFPQKMPGFRATRLRLTGLAAACCWERITTTITAASIRSTPRLASTVSAAFSAPFRPVRLWSIHCHPCTYRSALAPQTHCCSASTTIQRRVSCQPDYSRTGSS
jgi:hypothetical protein